MDHIQSWTACTGLEHGELNWKGSRKAVD